jgi:hypothetical protein
MAKRKTIAELEGMCKALERGQREIFDEAQKYKDQLREKESEIKTLRHDVEIYKMRCESITEQFNELHHHFDAFGICRTQSIEAPFNEAVSEPEDYPVFARTGREGWAPVSATSNRELPLTLAARFLLFYERKLIGKEDKESA